jgi:hypothetical protein
MSLVQPNNDLSCVSHDPNAKKYIMKPAFIIAIALIVFGILGLGYSGFSYTRRERVVDIGPIKADADVKHTVYIAPVVGRASLVGGIALLLGNRKGAGA